MSTKKEKSGRDQSIERLKAERQAHLREAKEYKERIHPLVHFLRKHKLRFNHAQVANERIEYFRLDEFDKLVESKRAEIDANPQLADLVRGSASEFIYFRRPDHIKIKYPKALEPVLPAHPDRKFASFRFDTTESRHWLTLLAIGAVLALVLFPIWPFWLKYGIWLVSLVLLVAIVGLLVVRLAVYLLLAIFDYHVWIFPNFLSSTGFWDSFIPILEVSRGDKSWLNVFIRLFALSSFLLLALHIYLNPTFIDDQVAFTKETIQDVHDWGVGKLKNEGNFSQRALTNLEEILNQTADVHETETSAEDEEEGIIESQEREEPLSEIQEEKEANVEEQEQAQAEEAEF